MVSPALPALLTHSSNKHYRSHVLLQRLQTGTLALTPEPALPPTVPLSPQQPSVFSNPHTLSFVGRAVFLTIPNAMTSLHLDIFPNLPRASAESLTRLQGPVTWWPYCCSFLLGPLPPAPVSHCDSSCHMSQVFTSAHTGCLRIVSLLCVHLRTWCSSIWMQSK